MALGAGTLENEGTAFLRKVKNWFPSDTASDPIRTESSTTTPWKHQDSHHLLPASQHPLCWFSCIYSTPCHSISLRYHLILSSQLCSDWFISVFTLKTSYAFLISPIQVHAKCLAHVFIQTSPAKCDADLWLHRKLTSSVFVFSENLILWMEGCLVCRAFFIGWIQHSVQSTHHAAPSYALISTLPFLHLTSRYSPQHPVLWPAKLTYYHLLSHESSALFLMFQKHLIVVTYCFGKHPYHHHVLDSLNSCKSW